MKPVQIVVLVLAGALVGAVLMKVVQRPHSVAAIPASTPQIQTQPEVPPPPPQTQAQETPAPPPAPVAERPITEAPAPRADIQEKPAARPQTVPHRQARRQAPPPANPRPLVMAKLEHPQSAAVAQTPAAPAPAEPAPAPSYVAPGSAPPVQESPMPQAPPAAPPVENVTPPAPPQPVPHTVTLNAGLLLPVRLVDGLSSERNSPGDTFLATLDHELVVDGFVIAERGARVEGRVVAADRGTKTKGDATLKVELTRLHTSDRQVVPIETDAFEKHMQAEGRQDAEKVGAGAAIGAVIGALAGGGKGAAIGAGVGGGAGAGDVLLTRKPATLASETRINFRLRTSVKLTERLD